MDFDSIESSYPVKLNPFESELVNVGGISLLADAAVVQTQFEQIICQENIFV